MLVSRGKSHPLLLYSAGTWLSHVIAKDYYNDQHYLWCTPIFDAKAVAQPSAVPPPSSCPKEIYLELAKAVTLGDTHCPKIKLVKEGILRGAQAKRKAGIITASEFKRIGEMVELAQVRDFKPYIYIMVFEDVKRLLLDVSPEKRANSLSPEYIIEHLPRPFFEVIDLST